MKSSEYDGEDAVNQRQDLNTPYEKPTKGILYHIPEGVQDGITLTNLIYSSKNQGMANNSRTLPTLKRERRERME